MLKRSILSILILFICSLTYAQVKSQSNNTRETPRAKPEDTEVWEPIPKVVVPGKINFNDPPSDAIILFDKDNLDNWVSLKDESPAKWIVTGDYFTVNKPTGDIKTKEKFTNYQLHIEFKIPMEIAHDGQSRGNSGIFLAATNGNAGGYELQVLDGYNNENKTYVNGMVGSIYKESIPLVNPAKKPGEWNVYDVIWTAPSFNADGTVKVKARATVFLNGVLVQNNVEIQGETAYIGKHEYVAHGPAPIKLQSHGDPSIPVSYRNIWLRKL